MAVPWKAGNAPLELDDDDEEDEAMLDVASAPPTRDVLDFLRGVLPNLSQRDIMKTWDSTREGSTMDERAQAVMLKLLDGGRDAAGPGTASAQSIDLTASEPNFEDAVTKVVKAGTGKGRVIDVEDQEPLAASPAGPSHQAPPSPTLDNNTAIVSLSALFPDIETKFAASALARPEWIDKPLAERMDLAAEHLFSLNGDYPKVEKQKLAPVSKKRKRNEVEEEEEQLAAEEARYLKRKLTDVPDCEYELACVAILCEEFPTMPKPHVNKVAKRHRYWYAPTYEALQADLQQRGNSIAFVPLKNPRKGKGAALELPGDLDVERNWLHRRLDRARAIKDAEEAEKLADAQEEAAGLLIACGCCYGEAPFRKMVQCAEAHLFCIDCAKQHVETLIGSRRIDLVCMDESGCTAEFHDDELKRFLDPGTLELIARFRQEKAVDLADIEGLEKCAFCDFACIIENPDEKLFRCGNEECGKILCRKCKKDDHLPKSCEEHEKDLAANSLHKVEEAMTAALVRNCPKCQQPYVKSDGCNKISCTHCGQLSCFICKKAISGYEHFAGGEAYTVARRIDAGATCPLFDDTIKRTHEEVEAARRAAAFEVAQANPNVTQDDLDRLREPEPPRAPAAAAYRPHAHHAHGHALHHHHYYLPGAAVAAPAAAGAAAGIAYNPNAFAFAGQAGIRAYQQAYVAQIQAQYAVHVAGPVPAVPARRGRGGRRR